MNAFSQIGAFTKMTERPYVYMILQGSTFGNTGFDMTIITNPAIRNNRIRTDHAPATNLSHAVDMSIRLNHSVSP